MAIVDIVSAATGHRLLTAADVAALPSELPSGPVDYELIEGVLVMMPPAGVPHGRVQRRFMVALERQGDQAGLGETLCEVGILLARRPDTLLGPDAMFFAASRLPIRMSPEGWSETIPNLVVEVRSKNDSLRELADKAKRYVAAGVELVWIADPERKVVTEYRSGAEPIEHAVGRDLTAEAILPGFRLPLAELFAD